MASPLSGTPTSEDSCLSALFTEVLPEDIDHRKQDSLPAKDSTEGLMLKATCCVTLLPAGLRCLEQEEVQTLSDPRLYGYKHDSYDIRIKKERTQ